MFRSPFASMLVASALSVLPLSGTLAGTTAASLQSGPHDLDLGDVRLHYVVDGKGPVVFVTSPGWGIGSLYLQRTLSPLTGKYTFVFVDTRGSGGSSRPADRRAMSQSTMADDLDRLRSRLGLDRIMLFGHSDGGTIALEYAERHGEHLQKLVLVEALPLGDHQAGTETAAILGLWADDPHYRAAVRAFRNMPPEDKMTDSMAEQLLQDVGPLYVSDPQRLWPLMQANLRGSHVSAYALAAEDESAAAAGRDQLTDAAGVTASTLIINGTVDFIVPYQAAQRLHAAIRSSRLSLYANKGHLPWLEDPDRFYRELDDFLAG